LATQVQEELMKVQEKFERDIVELHTCVWRKLHTCPGGKVNSRTRLHQAVGPVEYIIHEQRRFGAELCDGPSACNGNSVCY